MPSAIAERRKITKKKARSTARRRIGSSRYHEQAGAVPYRVTDSGKIEVLMVTNTNGDWIVPKGTIDPGWTAPETAMNECLEEAGVVAGSLGAELGRYEYHKGDRHCRVRLFALKVKKLEDEWLEEDERERMWVSLKAAVKIAAFKNLSQVIAELEDVVRR